MDTYLSFLALALVVVIVPGPDTFITLRNAVAGGRSAGLWTTAGVTVAGAMQGVIAAAGLGAIIQAAETVYEVITWVGVAYLAWLGIQAIRSSFAPAEPHGATSVETVGVRPAKAFRQGFLTNATNPKVLAFNLAMLPQFVGADAGLVQFLPYALTLAAFGGLFLVVVAALAGTYAQVLMKDRVRRGIEFTTGGVFLIFAGALAWEGSRH